MSFYRIQTSDRDPVDLLAPEGQVSRTWSDEDRIQVGVSVCCSREQLARYLVTGGDGIPYGTGDWNIVTLEGEVLFTRALDAEYGELLIRPTRIVDVTPMDTDEGFWALIDAAHNNLED